MEQKDGALYLPVRHDLAVLVPVLAVLASAAVEVASATVGEDGEEEERVVVRDDRVGTGNSAPQERLGPVRCDDRVREHATCKCKDQRRILAFLVCS